MIKSNFICPFCKALYGFDTEINEWFGDCEHLVFWGDEWLNSPGFLNEEFRKACGDNEGVTKLNGWEIYHVFPCEYPLHHVIFGKKKIKKEVVKDGNSR